MKFGFCALMLIAALSGAAQQSGGGPKVEVASIKPSEPGLRGWAIVPEAGGKLRTRNTTLKQLVLAAFHLHEAQLAGGPDWLDRDHFDITAQAEGHATLSEAHLYDLLAAVLTERFQMRTHRESRTMPYYSLVIGKAGPKLKTSTKPGAPDIRNRRSISAKGGTMEELASLLGWVMGRPVIDHTSLAGIYEFRLDWVPDESNIQGELAPVNQSNEAGGEGIFTALQEQLGLKLESAKGPVDVLVIDRAERPSEN